MSSIADTLMERRGALIKQAQDLATKGVTEGRDLTIEEQTSFDQMIAEAEKLDQRAKAIADGESRAKDLEDSFRKVTGHTPEARQETDGAFETWLRGVRDGGPQGFDLTVEKGAAQRAISSHGEARAMSATGGIGKSSVYSRLWEYAVESSQLLQAGVTIIETSDGNTLPLPRVTAHATGASAAANAPISASDAAITTVDLAATKHGYLTYVPNELLTDATFDIEGYLARAAGRELGNIIAAIGATVIQSGFTVTGVTGPTGAASGTFGAQATAGQGADLLIDLFHSVLPAYRSAASWLMSDSVAAMIRKFKNTQGDYVWQPPIVAGNPDLIIGRSVYIDPNLPDFTATPSADSGEKVIYFGDFSALAIRIAGGLRFERSTEAGFANDQTAFRALVRTGAAVVDPNAVKFLKLG